MGLFSLFSSKKKFDDGSAIWLSGRERISYLDPAGRRIDFEVYHLKDKGNYKNLVVSSSMHAYVDGNPVSHESKLEIIARCKEYFSARAEIVTFV